MRNSVFGEIYPFGGRCPVEFLQQLVRRFKNEHERCIELIQSGSGVKNLLINLIKICLIGNNIKGNFQIIRFILNQQVSVISPHTTNGLGNKLCSTVTKQSQSNLFQARDGLFKRFL